MVIFDAMIIYFLYICITYIILVTRFLYADYHKIYNEVKVFLKNKYLFT